MGVTTQSDVLKELAKKGMTEADARRMAAVYGLDYDEYIAKYITNKTPSTTTTPSMFISPTVSELTIIGDSVDIMIPPTEDNTIDEIRYWMEMNELEYSSFDTKEDLIDQILELEETDVEESDYFGYDIFLNNPFANKEYLVGNIDEGYILAPGDVLRIYVFGDNTYQSEVKIDLNGNILLPDIGMFFASGYTFSSLKNRLIAFLGKSFSGLIDSPK